MPDTSHIKVAFQAPSQPLNYMSNEDIPILVVDDAKFSSAIIAKALRGGGFSNVRFTNNPLQALRSLEKRPAQILIADWLMPSMDGLELTRRVKKLLDAIYKHFQIEHGLAKIKQESFDLEPYCDEFKRLYNEAEVLRNSTTVVMTEQHFVIKKFFITFVSRARYLFGECNKGTEQWCRAIMAPVFAQIHEHKSMIDQRLDNLRKIHENLDNLNNRIAYLEATNNKLEIQKKMTENVMAKIDQSLPSHEALPPENTAAARGAA